MKRGFLLMNTGSPDAPNEAALRDYLNNFLMDSHVIDLPWLLRVLLVRGVILPRRPAASAKLYQKIWTKEGSPLVHYTTELARHLGVEVGMAYGKPTVEAAVERLLATGVDEVCLLPLFPHAAMATTGACADRVKEIVGGRATLRVVPPFFEHPAFIAPLADAVKGLEEHLLFSYHGLPLRHLKKMPSPDYQAQCQSTTQAVISQAGISADRYSVSFQSRMGRGRWTQPYTEDVLRRLPLQGVRHLAVICPSFFCDGLETLEEIQIRGRETFLEAGGETFRMLPCLNDQPAAIHCLKILMASVESWSMFV